jgi:ABC-2 type transport system permease protein
MRLVAGELLKIWTAPRTLFALVLAELVLVALGTASTLDSGTSDQPFGLPSSLERDLIGAASASLLFALVLGILIATWEYRHGTITQTFLTTPVRELVVGTKVGVAALAGVLLTLPALLLMFVIAEIWVGAEGLHFGGEEWKLIGGLVLGAALVGALGAEIGSGTGRQLGAIVVAFAWVIFAEPALTVWTSLGDYLPARAILGGVLGAEGDDVPSFGKGIVVAAVYVIGLGAIALALTRRRDIT